tara:strand:+ start:17 stop:160 length:144 start_codon:yes stop_codon:yes gene_type:complete
MADIVSALIRNIWGSEKDEQVKPKSPKKKKKKKGKKKKEIIKLEEEE